MLPPRLSILNANPTSWLLFVNLGDCKMFDLILLRGLPGAGKSTLAEILSENRKYPVFSVDDYFTNEKGQYNFNYQENHLAYQNCLLQTENAMIEKAEKIFIHNTLTIDWELKAFFELADKHKYRVHVLTVENYHGSSNKHDISVEQLEKMALKYKVKLK
jgi:hypothetical protein